MLGGLREVRNGDDGDLCTSFVDAFYNAKVFKILASLIVVAINIIIIEIMRALVRFERHADASSAVFALTFKITVAQFLNTAIIPLVMNAKLSLPLFRNLYEGSLFQEMGFLSGDYSDFDREWYATVGAALTITMCANIVVPHAGPYMKALVARPLKIKVLGKRALTKVEFDKLYEYERFEIEKRYAALLNYLLVSVLYSAAMPFMLVLAAANFSIAYCLDKYAILRNSKQPMKYDSQLAKMVCFFFIPLAVVLHLAFTLYILSNPSEWKGATNNEYLFSFPEALGDYGEGDLVNTMLRSNPALSVLGDLAEKMKGSHWAIDDILPRVIKSNVLPLAVLLGGFIGL